jgi:hypothetical protein
MRIAHKKVSLSAFKYALALLIKEATLTLKDAKSICGLYFKNDYIALDKEGVIIFLALAEVLNFK